MRLLQNMLRNLLLHPRRIAAVDDRRAWRGLDLHVGHLHLTRAIRRATDRPRVGVMLPTSGLFPLALLATWRLGRTVVPLNYLVKRSDFEFMIDDAELDAVVTATPMIEHFGELPSGVRAIKLDELSFKGLPPLTRKARWNEDDLASLLYTSGTSGRPKGVMLTVGNLTANVEQIEAWARFTRDDVMLGVLPQFHSFGLTVLTLAPLAIGCKVVYTTRFMPKKIVSLMREHRPTVLVAIPSMYAALLSVKDAKPDDFTSLRYAVSGAEPLPEAVASGFKERYGVTINEGYGLTETSPVTHWCRPQEHRPRSVGPALPRVETKIVDASGAPLPPGEEGEILLRGPNVMTGYFKLPDDTAAVFDEEGYFRTGDMGRVEGGHLYITGRKKEMLIIGGENVFPREIEEVLNRHPSVHASAVIGMPDPTRGEVPLAFVELEEEATFDETSIRAFCRETLPQYKVPRDIRVVEQLPRSPTGKILRRELRAEISSSP